MQSEITVNYRFRHANIRTLSNQDLVNTKFALSSNKLYYTGLHWLPPEDLPAVIEEMKKRLHSKLLSKRL